MGILHLHGDGMFVIHAVFLVESAVPVPEVLEYLDIDMASGIRAGIAVAVEPASKDAISAIGTLRSIGIQGYDGDIGFVECTFDEFHQTEHTALVDMNLTRVLVA